MWHRLNLVGGPFAFPICTPDINCFSPFRRDEPGIPASSEDMGRRPGRSAGSGGVKPWMAAGCCLGKDRQDKIHLDSDRAKQFGRPKEGFSLPLPSGCRWNSGSPEHGKPVYWSPSDDQGKLGLLCRKSWSSENQEQSHQGTRRIQIKAPCRIILPYPIECFKWKRTPLKTLFWINCKEWAK